ncbi:MAG: hypothetical protein M1833_006427 [Piccolia ochrophora]|nr:MAG: hypothetical protein M1833_006427 [Piccolia ochrophora]
MPDTDDFEAKANPGVLHHYSPNLVAFEHRPNPSAPRPLNTICWIGGLSDGLLTVPYPRTIAHALPPTWCLVEILLSSSYTGWGTSSVVQDANEISDCITYLRRIRPHGKMVLMGHSTGCQDTMEYLTGDDAETRPPLDGAILQAPASDREGMLMTMKREDYDFLVDTARRWVAEGKGEDIMPRDMIAETFVDAPCSARRWLSLASPDKSGDEDFFSSDLADEQLARTFGRVKPTTPLCVLFGEKDQFVAESVDKERLVRRWADAVKRGGGVVDEATFGVVKGASHNLRGDPDAVVDDMVDRVVSFLSRVDGSREGAV